MLKILKICRQWRRLILVTIVVISACVFIESSYKRNHSNGVLSEITYKQDAVSEESIIHQAKETVNVAKSPPCSKQIAFVSPGKQTFNDKLIESNLYRLDFSRNERDIWQAEVTCAEQECNITFGVVWRGGDFLKHSDGVLLHDYMDNDVMTEVSTSTNHNASIFYWTYESPFMVRRRQQSIPDTPYHFDINYHSSASATFPFGMYDSSNPRDNMEGIKWAKKKTRLVAWMASNCNATSWPRKDFVYDLRNHIPVDMYGKCGNLTCLPKRSSECLRVLRKYKFYLALENSECDEYITEKLWVNALKNEVVPVVYGGRKDAYEKLAPPHSFIHIADFGSTKELAKYLLDLHNNDTMYNEYFQWRLKGDVVKKESTTSIFCRTLTITSSQSVNKRNVSESHYFNSCRNLPGPKRKIAYDSYDTWSPWK